MPGFVPGLKGDVTESGEEENECKDEDGNGDDVVFDENDGLSDFLG